MGRAVPCGAIVALVLLVAALAAVFGGSPVAAGRHPGSAFPATRFAGTTPPIVVGIDPQPDVGPAPLTVDLRAVATGGTGKYTEFAWTLGDGGQGTGERFNYTFERAGLFLVELQVTDSSGATGSASVEVEVNVSTVASSTGFVSAAALPLSGGLAAGAALGLVAWRWGAGRRPDPVPPARDPLEPTAAAPGVPSEVAPPPSPVAPPSAESVGLSQRLLAHLLRQPAFGPHEVVAPGRTQSDLAQALGASQSSVSEILTRLAAAGVVAASTRHVRGRPRRVRVYALTSYGNQIARQVAPMGSADFDTYRLLGRLPDPRAPSPGPVDGSTGSSADRLPALRSGPDGP